VRGKDRASHTKKNGVKDNFLKLKRLQIILWQGSGASEESWPRSSESYQACCEASCSFGLMRL